MVSTETDRFGLSRITDRIWPPFSDPVIISIQARVSTRILGSVILIFPLDFPVMVAIERFDIQIGQDAEK